VSAYAEDDGEDEEEEEDDDEGDDADEKSVQAFNPMIPPNDEIPQWLVDANKDAEKQRKQAARAGRKKKRLTDDWRFWAACIAGVGFLSAFWNIYQQTGGLGSDMGIGGDRQELII
jgi:hypothetical protein